MEHQPSQRDTAVASPRFRPPCTDWCIRIVELTGEVTELLWRSPHVRFSVRTAAAAAQAAFDPVADDPIGDCIPKDMPWIMSQPYPMEIIDQGDVILLHMEEYDAVRRFYMGPETETDDSPTRLGRSRGRWVGEELHVTTRHIDWPYFDSSGIRQSEAIELYERFSLSEDGSRLNYHLTATDPVTFTQPVELDKAWM